jgi:hypothetical protein
MIVRRRTTAIAFVAICLTAGCSRHEAVLEIAPTIMYEKPRIEKVVHVLTDSRDEGGAAIVKVAMTGDPGLTAFFDIYPGVAMRQPMHETAEGEYVGEFSFPEAVVGGPFSIIVRLRHQEAGEVTWRDPDLITIPLLEPSR